MDLLDRYLQAVKFFLPRAQQDDIGRELSDNLLSQMEDREEELGRPLTEAEQADILRRHGHPMLVAGRYRTHQQLIGPAFFPIYLFALKAGLAAALLLTAAVAAITAVVSGDPVPHLVRGMLAFPGRALMVFAWTTLVFAAIDVMSSQVRLAHEWDPRALPKVVKHAHAIPRARTICELSFVLAALVWLLLIPRAPFLLLGPAVAFVELAPVWGLVYVPIVLLTVATAGLHVVNFLRPYWTRPRLLARVAIHVATLSVFGMLLRADGWFVLRPGAAAPDGMQLDQILRLIHVAFQIGFVVAAIITAIEIVKDLYRMRYRGSTPLAADRPAAP
jgi:hypothetical protein